jgi:hypothetical protein
MHALLRSSSNTICSAEPSTDRSRGRRPVIEDPPQETLVEHGQPRAALPAIRSAGLTGRLPAQPGNRTLFSRLRRRAAAKSGAYPGYPKRDRPVTSAVRIRRTPRASKRHWVADPRRLPGRLVPMVASVNSERTEDECAGPESARLRRHGLAGELPSLPGHHRSRCCRPTAWRDAPASGTPRATRSRAYRADLDANAYRVWPG